MDKEQQNAYAKQWRKDHPDYLTIWRKEHSGYFAEYVKAVKREVLTHYGNGELACVCCGFQDLKALSIDHINSGGNKHRKQIGRSAGAGFYLWLKKNNYPLGYQTLCMNCQYIKRK